MLSSVSYSFKYSDNTFAFQDLVGWVHPPYHSPPVDYHQCSKHSLSPKACPFLSCFHTTDYIIFSWKPTHSSRPILSLSPFMKPSWTITVSRGIKRPCQVSALEISSLLTPGLEGPWGQGLYAVNKFASFTKHIVFTVFGEWTLHKETRPPGPNELTMWKTRHKACQHNSVCVQVDI